jgi:hypothetical protein
MNSKSVSPEKPTLEDVEKKFILWRETRKSRKPIPKELWEAAINLADQYVLNVIAKKLHLSHAILKEKIRQSKEKMPFTNNNEIQFVEFPTLPEIYPHQCEITMENSSGSKMTIHLKGKMELNFLELGKSFWDNTK